LFLASIFGTIVLKSPENDLNADKKAVQPIKTNSSSQLQSAERKKAAFVFHFLVNDFDI
jgi:hypothetical protein